MFRPITPIVKNLLIINIALFVVATYVMPNLSAIFALYHIQSPRFIPTQFLTYMFMHADGWHLISNMFGLFVFGPLLEEFIGPKKLLTLWMVCGVGAGVLYSGYTSFQTQKLDNLIAEFYSEQSPENFRKCIRHFTDKPNPELVEFMDYFDRNPDNENINRESKVVLTTLRNSVLNGNMVGASGALFGVLIAFGMLFPNTQLLLLFPPIPVKAKYLILAYSVYTVYAVIIDNPQDNVAHFAHLSGLVIGAGLVYYWKKSRKSFY